MRKKPAWGGVQSEPQGCGAGGVCVAGGRHRNYSGFLQGFSLSDQTFLSDSPRGPKAAWEEQRDCRVWSPQAHP